MEILIVLAIALVVFGPKRLPELGRSVGRGMREFKGSLDGAGPPPPAEAARLSEAAPPSSDEPVATEPGPSREG